jgi:phosphoribosylformimino-5-aminoimidazole carboxamide ribotide isomerase
VGTVQDLRALEERGVAAAIVGMALYTGALDARAVAEEFEG